METIDLHGIRHEDAIKIITEACAMSETPFVVITGRSDEMKKIVSAAVAPFQLKARETINNPGRVIVDDILP